MDKEIFIKLYDNAPMESIYLADQELSKVPILEYDVEPGRYIPGLKRKGTIFLNYSSYITAYYEYYEIIKRIFRPALSDKNYKFVGRIIRKDGGITIGYPPTCQNEGIIHYGLSIWDMHINNKLYTLAIDRDNKIVHMSPGLEGYIRLDRFEFFKDYIFLNDADELPRLETSNR